MWNNLWEDIQDARNLDFTYLNELINPAIDDELIINDISAGEIKKVVFENILLAFVITDDYGLIFTDGLGFVLNY